MKWSDVCGIKYLIFPGVIRGGGDAYNFFSNLSLYYCKEWNFVKQVFQKTVNWPCLAIQWISKYGTDWRERKSIYWSIFLNENEKILIYLIPVFREIIARIKTCFAGDNEMICPQGKQLAFKFNLFCQDPIELHKKLCFIFPFSFYLIPFRQF